jgi:hypothetical protein
LSSYLVDPFWSAQSVHISRPSSRLCLPRRPLRISSTHNFLLHNCLFTTPIGHAWCSLAITLIVYMQPDVFTWAIATPKFHSIAPKSAPDFTPV